MQSKCFEINIFIYDGENSTFIRLKKYMNLTQHCIMFLEADGCCNVITSSLSRAVELFIFLGKQPQLVYDVILSQAII